jgi:hypothetical protein
VLSVDLFPCIVPQIFLANWLKIKCISLSYCNG